MSKPILVTNNQDWLRLAPVLEKQGYVWRSEQKPTEWPTILNFFPRTILLDENKKLALCFNKETQSVDEYLFQNPKLEWKGDTQTGGYETEATVTINLAPNYKALYEAQSRAIQEAIAEMEKEKDSLLDLDKAFDDPECYGKANGLSRAKEILTAKLNPTTPA